MVESFKCTYFPNKTHNTANLNFVVFSYFILEQIDNYTVDSFTIDNWVTGAGALSIVN